MLYLLVETIVGLMTVTPVEVFSAVPELVVAVVVGLTMVTPPELRFLPVLANVSSGDVESA